MGKWFAQDHDVTAAAALRDVEDLRLAHQLVSLGYGPERSVIEAAIQEAGWVRCPGCVYVGPSANLAAHTRAGSCTADTPAGDQPDAPREPEPGPELAESGAARGRLLPGADDPVWEAVPMHLRQLLRGYAHQLVTPLQGPLKKKESRRLLSAVRAAARMRMTGAHWIILLTARRESFGSPRSHRARAFYEALEQVAAQHAAPAGDQGAGPAVRSGGGELMESTS
ncbi:hypothetical protein [Streptomyces sirii]|uniref:hypothetical protein n=1 Tax=Streptomyces sirii TaxID=3127701 RepID=UPI003D3658BE